MSNVTFLPLLPQQLLVVLDAPDQVAAKNSIVQSFISVRRLQIGSSVRVDRQTRALLGEPHPNRVDRAVVQTGQSHFQLFVLAQKLDEHEGDVDLGGVVHPEDCAGDQRLQTIGDRVLERGVHLPGDPARVDERSHLADEDVADEGRGAGENEAEYFEQENQVAQFGVILLAQPTCASKFAYTYFT